LASADVASPAPGFASPASGLAAGLAPDDLKSVWYQPLPFSWKPAAETSFTSASFAQAGQVTSGASLNFCSASNLWSHALQRYS